MQCWVGVLKWSQVGLSVPSPPDRRDVSSPVPPCCHPDTICNAMTKAPFSLEAKKQISQSLSFQVAHWGKLDIHVELSWEFSFHCCYCSVRDGTGPGGCDTVLRHCACTENPLALICQYRKSHPSIKGTHWTQEFSCLNFWGKLSDKSRALLPGIRFVLERVLSTGTSGPTSCQTGRERTRLEKFWNGAGGSAPMPFS